MVIGYSFFNSKHKNPTGDDIPKRLRGFGDKKSDETKMTISESATRISAPHLCTDVLTFNCNTYSITFRLFVIKSGCCCAVEETMGETMVLIVPCSTASTLYPMRHTTSGFWIQEVSKKVKTTASATPSTDCWGTGSDRNWTGGRCMYHTRAG